MNQIKKIILDHYPDSDETLIDEYLYFCETQSFKQEPLNEITENHHILPRSLFKEYESFSKNPWNKSILTPEDHYRAHEIAAELFGGNMWWTLKMMIDVNEYLLKEQTPEVYGEIRRNAIEWLNQYYETEEGKRVAKERREKLSQREDYEEYKNRISETCKEVFGTPEKRQERSDIAFESWNSETYRINHKNAMNEVIHTNSYKQKQRESQLKRFEDPEARESCSRGQKKRWSKPEEREKASEATKKLMSDPKVRERISKTSKGKKFYYDPNGDGTAHKFYPGEQPEGWLNGRPKSKNQNH